MNKRFLLISVTSLVLAFVMTQSVMAKKIMYKHHQYSGKLSKENIPQGKGEIDISGIVIKGMFDGTSISGASFERDWLRYDGEITFNESNRITLKAGGILTKYYYEGIRIYDEKNVSSLSYEDLPDNSKIDKAKYEAYIAKYPVYVYPNELPQSRKSITETLSDDIEIENDDLLKDIVKIPISVEMKGVPLELWPPTVQQEIKIPLKRYTKWKAMHVGTVYGNDGGEIYLHVLTPQLKSGKVSISNYKDENGRIWDYIYEPEKGYSSKEKIAYKVTFPDGSYCSSETKGKIVKP